jgi:hypothetical protein
MSNRQIKLEKKNPTHAQYNKLTTNNKQAHNLWLKILNCETHDLTSLEVNTKNSKKQTINGTVIPTRQDNTDVLSQQYNMMMVVN